MNKKYNFWFIHEDEAREITSLPVGIYYVIPTDYKKTLSLSLALESILNGRELTPAETEVVKSACINSTEDDRNFYQSMNVNHITMYKGHMGLVWGKNIVTNIDQCETISEAKVLSQVLQLFIDRNKLSTIREYITEQHFERTVSYWYYNHLKEMIKTLMTNQAIQMLEQLNKALYIKGEY